MTDEGFWERMFKKREEADPKVVEQVIEDASDMIFEKLSPAEETVAERLIDRFVDKIDLAEQFIDIMPLHYDSAGLWWVWDLARFCWKIVDEIDILNFIKNSSPANIINSKERNEILAALKQVARAHVPEQPKKTWIQFEKEIIDVETGERFPANPKYFITNPIPHQLGHSEETPTIDRLLKEWVVGGSQNETWVRTAKEVLAFCLMPDYFIERIICLYGSGCNGKSCFLKMLRIFVGDKNCCSTDLETLVHSRFESTRLFHKLVCQMGETNMETMNNTQLIKKLVSGKDLISMEFKNKGLFDSVNYAKLLIATNNLPPSDDKQVGFYRRWLIMDFPNCFEEKLDVLSTIPEIEYRNLALACVGILMDLLKNKCFTNDGTIETRTAKYEEKSNPIDKFLKEFTIDDFSGYITSNDFMTKLNQWCKENRFRAMSDQTVAKKLKDKGYEKGREYMNWLFDGKGGHARVWKGLKWKN